MERLMSSERLHAASSHSRRWKAQTTRESRRGGLNPHLWQVCFHKWVHTQDDDPDSLWTEPCDINIVRLTFLCHIWWTLLAILALWRVRQEDCSKLEASLGFMAEFEGCPDYIVSSRPTWATNECPISKKKNQFSTDQNLHSGLHCSTWTLASKFNHFQSIGPLKWNVSDEGNMNKIIPH